MKFKEVNKIFKPIRKKYYLGKTVYFTPYFYPINCNPKIISIRKLIKEEGNFTNFPLVRRNKYWVKKIFGNYWFITVGWPIKIHNGRFAWKDKFGTPRFEWEKIWSLYFFNWQFCIRWTFDDITDIYWEMVLWWYYYCDKDIIKAEETWPWINSNGASTWNKNYLK